MPMTKSSAVALTFLYALGYPIGALSVSAMTPMLVLVARFALAGAILATWALIARAVWPTGRTLCHVIVAGLLMQAVQFCALYEALEHGAPAVLGAVVISMNPVVTAVLAALFLDERLNRWRLVALALGWWRYLPHAPTGCSPPVGSTPCWRFFSWRCWAWRQAGCTNSASAPMSIFASTAPSRTCPDCCRRAHWRF